MTATSPPPYRPATKGRRPTRLWQTARVAALTVEHPAQAVPFKGHGRDARWRQLATLAGALVVGLAAVSLRVPGMRTDLWRDEALTVGAAEHVRHLPSLLRADGSPPLFHFLLGG